VHVTDASIHAILPKSDVVVTQSSAVAFEAMIHEVPSVLAGPSDFHHMLETISNVSELKAVMERAINSKPPYSAYLFWFLRERMIKPAQENSASNRIKRVFRLAKR
jgi:CDP-glycerol glycerophosphotransferase (TagB/SpsB family)